MLLVLWIYGNIVSQDVVSCEIRSLAARPNIQIRHKPQPHGQTNQIKIKMKLVIKIKLKLLMVREMK